MPYTLSPLRRAGMHIKYVVSSMIFWWRENPVSFEQECDFLRAQGYGIELWPNIKSHHECRYERGNWNRLKEATRGMVVSMHGRVDYPDIEQWREQIECARMLDAHIVTDLPNFGIPEGEAVNGCDFSAEIVKIAQENGVQVCLETGQLDKMVKLAEKFDSLRFCLDTGFANIDPVYTFKQYIDELADKTAHLHLCDNYGQIDDHEPPGLKGGIPRENWEYLIESLKKYGNTVVASFEMFPPGPYVMLRQASEFIFDELNWPSQPEKNYTPRKKTRTKIQKKSSG